MLKDRRKFDDEEEVYIPDLPSLGEFSDDFNLHDRTPRSNAGISLEWSALEQQMFDMLLINRFNTDSHDMLEEEAKAVIRLTETFDSHEIARICSVALLAVQLALVEEKNFENEYRKYRQHVKEHPEDIEELAFGS